MTHPDPHQSHRPERTADVTQPKTGDAGGPPTEREARIPVNAEAAYGGADAVQKTSYVVGSGTEPGTRNRGDATAHPTSGSGPNFVAWGVGAIVAAVALVYLFGMLT